MSKYISIFLKMSHMIYIQTKDLRSANVWMIHYFIDVRPKREEPKALRPHSLKDNSHKEKQVPENLFYLVGEEKLIN